MSTRTVRTTLALPTDLLEATDEVVRTGRARSRNELIATALRHELQALERAAIDAAFAPLAGDPDHRAETTALETELGMASWEAFRSREDAV